MQGTEIELRTASLRLAACSWGPQDGLPVLALHGWLDNAASFAALAELLPKTRIVAVDLPGHGCSEHRAPGTPYHFADYVVDVVAVANYLNWQQFALMGHSMGAGVATLTAAVIPERITRLVLLDGLGPLAAKPEDGPKQLKIAINRILNKDIKQPPVYLSLDDAARARYSAAVHKSLRLSREAALLLAQRGTREVAGGVTWSTDPRLRIRSQVYLTQPQVLAYIDAISAPALLIRAESGVLWERLYMPERYARLKQLQIVDIPGLHHVHMENPALVAQYVRPFLEAA